MYYNSHKIESIYRHILIHGCKITSYEYIDDRKVLKIVLSGSDYERVVYLATDKFMFMLGDARWQKVREHYDRGDNFMGSLLEIEIMEDYYDGK